MPKYNIKVDYMSGFKDCVYGNNKVDAFSKFLNKYKLDPSVSYIASIQEIFELKGEFDE